MNAGAMVRGAEAPEHGSWRALFEASPCALGLREVVGDDLVHLADNPAMAGLFGRAESELVGHSDGELGIDPDTVSRSIARCRLARAEGRPRRFTIAVEGRALHHVEGAVTAIPGDEGGERYVVVGWDVAALRARHDELSERERFAALSLLAGSLAHAVVDPASYALLRVASAERALDRDDIGRLREDLTAIREGLEQVIAAVRTTRVVGAAPRSSRIVDLAELLEEAIPLAVGGVGGRNRVVFEREPAPSVMADPTALIQPLVGLVRTALAAAGTEGRVRIALGTRDGAAAVEILALGAIFDDRVLTRDAHPFAGRSAAGRSAAGPFAAGPFAAGPSAVGPFDDGLAAEPGAEQGDGGLALYLARGALESLGGRLVLDNHGGARATVLLPGAPGDSA